MNQNYYTGYSMGPKGVQRTRVDNSPKGVANYLKSRPDTDIVLLLTEKSEPLLLTVSGFIEFCGSPLLLEQLNRSMPRKEGLSA